MELDKLKSAWGKVSSESNEHKYSEEQVGNVLNKRTKDIIGKIKRNIYIGLGIVLVWVSISIIAELLTSSLLDNLVGKDNSEIVLFWGLIVDTVLYILIIGSLIAFWFKFNKLQKDYNRSVGLEQNITQQINLIKWYRKMFYLVLVIVLVVIAVAFSTGFLLGIEEAGEAGLNMSNEGFLAWVIFIVAFIVGLFIILGIYYLLFSLFFKRLYGRLLIKLNETLKELQEPESV
ncbi:MAG: hypothetical protein PF436_06675 [Prolixibacteraceae bacterium]|jgi:uncharacterized BrkB/YihY/UPF0761 family membrane protein|nr:hypothetical protein [Prolixibacteraceae bacterium]